MSDFTEKQKEAMDSTERMRLFGGSRESSRFGVGGNSYVEFRAICHAFTSPGQKVLLVFGSSHRKEAFLQDFARVMLVAGAVIHQNGGDLRFSIPNGSELRISVVKSSSDITRLRGVNYDEIAFDEEVRLVSRREIVLLRRKAARDE